MATVVIGLSEAARDASGESAATEFLDFTFDGESLRSELAQRGFSDMVGPLWTSVHGRQLWPETVARLLGKASGDAPGNRVSVFVCGECGDLGCGAVTVRLELSDGLVTWSDWGYQNNYEDEISREGLKDLPPLEFDRIQYESVVTSVLTP
jgi:hypothetical protein